MGWFNIRFIKRRKPCNTQKLHAQYTGICWYVLRNHHVGTRRCQDGNVLRIQYIPSVKNEGEWEWK